MEHRKRNKNQQRVELTTLLLIVMKKNLRKQSELNARVSKNLTKALAFEAIASLEDCDHCDINVKVDEFMEELQ